MVYRLTFLLMIVLCLPATTMETSLIDCRIWMGNVTDFHRWRSFGNSVIPVSLSRSHSDLPVLVVGAGVGGLATMKELRELAINFVGMEAFSAAGGVWNAANPQSPAYPGLVTNSSQTTTKLSGDHWLEGFGDYIDLDEAKKYLINFARAHQLNDYISYGFRVDHVEELIAGDWLVKYTILKTGERKLGRFRDVIVASGTHNKANAKYPIVVWDQARAGGLHTVHSSGVNDFSIYRDKKLLIVGAGTSAWEQAVLAYRAGAKKVMVSVRTWPWFAPDYVFGIPADKFAAGSPKPPSWFFPRISNRIQNYVFRLIQRLTVGFPQTEQDFPKPEGGILDRIPVTVRGVEKLIKEGKIILHSEIDSIYDGTAHFKGDQGVTEVDEPLDAIIFATGYHRRFPFLDQSMVDLEDENFDMSLLMFHPHRRGLIMLNELMVAQGGWPVYSAQARAVAAYIKAKELGRPNAEIFDSQLRQLPPLYYKNFNFGLADKWHVDVPTVEAIYGDFAEWILH